jgi:hypothetical protein
MGTSTPPGTGTSTPPGTDSTTTGTDSATTRTSEPDIGPPGDDGTSSGDADAEYADELRRQLAATPAEVVVGNHCYGLFELAAVYLSGAPPQLAEARLAIDALGFLVGGLGSRLGASTATLQDALAQIRLAYVQLEAASRAQMPDSPD